MALDFPSSPTNGQVFENYTYDSTAGAWRSSALYSLGVPAGGTTNQILSKIDGSNYNTQWTSSPTLTGATLTGLTPAGIVTNTAGGVLGTVADIPIINGGTGVETGAGITPVIPTSATTGTVGATGTVTFSAQTSISINGCFTSAYTRYRVFVDFTTTNMTGTNTTMVMRTSGTNNTTANYSFNGYRFMDWAPAQFNSTGGAAWTWVDSNAQTGTSYLSGYTDFMYPQQTARTYINHVANLYGAAGFDGAEYIAGMFNANTSFDGFSLLFSASSTGTIKIYGYN